MADYSASRPLLNPNNPPPAGPQGPQDHLGRGRGRLLQSSEDIDIPIDRPFAFFPTYFEPESAGSAPYSSVEAADEIVRRSDLLGHEFFAPDFDLQPGPDPIPDPPFPFPDVPIEEPPEEEPPEEEPPDDFEADPGQTFPDEEDEEPAPPPPYDPGDPDVPVADEDNPPDGTAEDEEPPVADEPYDPPPYEDEDEEPPVADEPAPGTGGEEEPPIKPSPDEEPPFDSTMPERPPAKPDIPEVPPFDSTMPEVPPPEPPLPPDGPMPDPIPPEDIPPEPPEAPFIQEIPEGYAQPDDFDPDFTELAVDGYQYGSAAANVIASGVAIAEAVSAGAGAAGAVGAGAGAATGGAIAGVSSTGIGAIVAVAVVIAAGIYGVIMGSKARVTRHRTYMTTGGLALHDNTKATHDQLGSGHIYQDHATGRVFFTTDWEAESLRAKLVPGGDYINFRGMTMATELDPETGAQMQQGFFGDTGYGFTAAGFMPHTAPGRTNATVRAQWEYNATRAGQDATRDAIMISGATGSQHSEFQGVDPGVLEVVHVPATGGEAGEAAYNKVVPKVNTPLWQQQQRNQQAQENAR